MTEPFRPAGFHRCTCCLARTPLTVPEMFEHRVFCDVCERAGCSVEARQCSTWCRNQCHEYYHDDGSVTLTHLWDGRVGHGATVREALSDLHLPPSTDAQRNDRIRSVLGSPNRDPEHTGDVSGLDWAALVDDAGLASPARTRPGVLHNLVAHPLLVLWPRAGEWLHERTRP